MSYVRQVNAGQIDANAVVWGLFGLIFVALLMAIVGLLVAVVVIIARLFVPKTAPRGVRGTVTGAVAMISSCALTFALFGLVPLSLSADRWMTAGVTGVLVGGVFALISYRHTSEV